MRLGAAIFSSFILAALPAGADSWDFTTPSDDAAADTGNSLVHGSNQWHDFAGGVEDWYVFEGGAHSSWEFVTDGTDQEAIGATIYLYASDGTTYIDGSGDLGVSYYTQSMRYKNITSSTNNRKVLVNSNYANDSNNKYNIRVYETTYSIPRFNNSASQFTILIVQNTGRFSVSASFQFFSTAGALLGTSTSTIAARNTLVLNTSTLGFANGTSGSVLVVNDGRYGQLSGKAVALEPGTGFTFDTQMVPIPN